MELDAIDHGDEDWLSQLDRLSAMAERQSKALAMLATKLRLTQQSRYAPHVAARAAGKAGDGVKPWQQYD